VALYGLPFFVELLIIGSPHGAGLAKRNPWVNCQCFFYHSKRNHSLADANMRFDGGCASLNRGHWEVLEVDIDRKRMSLSIKGME